MLAVIGKIISLVKVENADTLQQAEVVCGKGGKWLGVVKDGEFAVNDKVVVFLQDALLPQNQVYQFMEKSKWIVKIAKLRGAYSECLIMGLQHFFADTESLEIGRNVEYELGVTKYEKPLPATLAGNAAGNFPSFIPKTDEVNFQSVPELIAKLNGRPYYVTVKYDGSSGTAYKKDGVLHVCSRNLELKPQDGNAFWQVATKYDLQERLPEGMVLQFEVYGTGIQGNPLGITGVDGALFNVFDIAKHEYLGFEAVKAMSVTTGMPMVAVIETGESFAYTASQLRTLSEGTYPNGKQREGIVVRSQSGERISFKVINSNYK